MLDRIIFQRNTEFSDTANFSSQVGKNSLANENKPSPTSDEIALGNNTGR